MNCVRYSRNIIGIGRLHNGIKTQNLWQQECGSVFDLIVNM